MERKVFQSRLLREGSYDPNSRRMTLIFRGGEEYHGIDVPPSLWEGLKESPSPGRFYHSVVKPMIRFSKS
jgi:KTSC domain